MSPSYLLVLPISPMPVGTVYPSGEALPLHCTLMPWFTLADPRDLAALSATVQEFADVLQLGAIMLVSEAPALFGPKQDIPVHTIAWNKNLNNFHTGVLMALAKLGFKAEEIHYVGAGYRPHVTTRPNGESLPPGSTVTVRQIAMLERVEPPPGSGKLGKKVIRLFGA